MNKLVSLVSGIIFGFGLVISEITNPTPKIIPEINDANLFISNF